MTDKQWEATKKALRMMADDYLKKMWANVPMHNRDNDVIREKRKEIQALREAMYAD